MIRSAKIRNEKIRNLEIRSLRPFFVSLLVLLCSFCCYPPSLSDKAEPPRATFT